MPDQPQQDKPTVYVVDEDAAVRESLGSLLGLLDLDIQTFPTAEAFLEAYDPQRPGCLVTEVYLRGMSGLDLLEHLQDEAIDLPVIVVASHGDVPMAVRALRAGARDFIEKPFVDRVLVESIRRALRSRSVRGSSV